MDKETQNAVERAIAWIGPVFIVTYFWFWGVMGHNIPPPNFVGMTAEELVANHNVVNAPVAQLDRVLPSEGLAV